MTSKYHKQTSVATPLNHKESSIIVIESSLSLSCCIGADRERIRKTIFPGRERESHVAIQLREEEGIGYREGEDGRGQRPLLAELLERHVQPRLLGQVQVVLARNLLQIARLVAFEHFSG